MNTLVAIELDYPRCRAAAVCACCGQMKPVTLLVCWPCYRQHGLRYAMPPMVTKKLDAAEIALLEGEKL